MAVQELDDDDHLLEHVARDAEAGSRKVPGRSLPQSCGVQALDERVQAAAVRLLLRDDEVALVELDGGNVKEVRVLEAAASTAAPSRAGVGSGRRGGGAVTAALTLRPARHACGAGLSSHCGLWRRPWCSASEATSAHAVRIWTCGHGV